jgi:NAD+ synthase (glutamine-hydrolysing)
MRQTSYRQSVGRHKAQLQGFQTVRFELGADARSARSAAGDLLRKVERFPYVPADASRRDERCMEVYNIQVQALVQRLSHTAAEARHRRIGRARFDARLLVCAKAMDLLGCPRTDILGFTMPGFATSERTLDQAKRLMARWAARPRDRHPAELRADAQGPRPPFARWEPVYDIAFENVQAGERTSHLFRLANFHGGFVVGTGDLSELALGWCTYGVGDHMSHYNVNASVPKTLIKHLVRWVADSDTLGEAGSTVLRDVLDTEVSPELIPGQDAKQPGQSTEDTLGPYELHDFFLYQVLRFGFSPTKVAFLAHAAWHDRERGAWPDGPDVARNAYTLADIKRHLQTFLYRFFQTSQFKRSCIPNAPKVGSGGSLSPRGDWRAPSDGQAAVWLADLEEVPGDAAQQPTSPR